MGVDRDSALVSHVYDEKNEAVKILIRQVIKVAHENNRKVGICGQAPSDYPEFAEFLVQEGIDSISLNPDTVLKTRERIALMEKKIAVKPNRILRIAGASKMLLIFGVLGLLTALGGYTCQTVSGGEQVAKKDMQIEVANQVALAKSDLKRQMEKEFEERKMQQKSVYSESGFVNFTFNYPSGWTVKHLESEVVFSSSDKTEWLSVLEKRTSAVILSNEVVTGTWNGYPVKVFENTDNGKTEKIMLVYPNGYKKSTTVIKIFGTKDRFDDLTSSFVEFIVKP